MTPSEFRRLLIRNPTLTLTGFTVNGVERPHKFRDIPRVVQHVRSKDFTVAEAGHENNPSYMQIPKVSELRGDRHSFTITIDDSIPGRTWIVALTYKVS